MIGSIHQRGNSWWRSLRGRAAVGIALVTAAASLCATRAAGDAAAQATTEECQSFDDPLAELFVQPQSRPGVARPKLRKRYPAVQPPTRRRGREQLVTTLFNVHEHEALPIFRDAPPPPAVLADLFRCRGFGTRVDLAPPLIAMVLEAAEHFAAARVEVISAYRSSKFNDTLAKKGRRVAAESRHTRGEAIDFRLVGTEARVLGAWVFERFEGGVGTYAGDEFVHIDIGPKRRWKGR